MGLKDKDEYNAYMRKYMLRRYHQRRGEAIQRLGGKCNLCSSDKGLQLDHIDWRAKSFSVGKMWSVSKARYLAELKKCQVLCFACNAVKTASDLSEIMRAYW
ncbi:hypothetical protein LCGC14_2981900, partial [marine sediment metagenome]